MMVNGENEQQSPSTMRSGEHKPDAKWTAELKMILSEFLDKPPKQKTEDTESTYPKEQRPPVRCHYCHKLGHVQRDCKKKKNNTQSGNGQEQH